MIDTQLRKVGWEADTENLRYGKGIRPQKGKILQLPNGPRFLRQVIKAGQITPFLQAKNLLLLSKQKQSIKIFLLL